MATRSAIGIKNEKGEIKAIYCHYDGYPEYNGRILVEHYKTREKVEELLALGDISSLDERVKPNENEVHSFENPLKNVTVAYHRDMGRELEEAETFNTIGELIAYFNWSDYYYIFEDGEWYLYNLEEEKKLVTDVLKKEN